MRRDSPAARMRPATLTSRALPAPPRRRTPTWRASARDRKSVVEGKSEDLGGRRIIKKKQQERSLPQQQFLEVFLADDVLGHGGPILCQAEDGIRDYKVTGVQTCALPI